MTDAIVTIRLPDSLVSELRKLAGKQHYVDSSELIRSVLRKRYERSHASAEMLSDSIVEDIKKHAIRSSEAKLAEELQNIKKRLREELK